MKIKRLILSAVMLLAAAALTACTKDYSDDDVKKYIREEMKISSFSVIGGPEEVKGEDGYTDRMWTVSTKDFDLGEELVFHVYDDYRWGMEWITNSLKDDLEYQKECVLLEKFALPEGFLVEEITDGSGRANWHNIVCGFTHRADFEKGLDLVRSYRKHAEAYPTIGDTEMTLRFESGDSGNPWEWRISGIGYSIEFDVSTTDEEVEKEIKNASDDYLMDCIASGLLDRMDEYSIDERSAVINADIYNTEIRRIGEKKPAYPGYSYANYYNIPCGTLYRILEEEGYELTGSWTSFSFTGNDGNVYSFAYDENGRGEVDVEDINAVTDLDLDDGARLKTVVIDRELLALLDTDAESFAASIRALEGGCYYRNLEIEEGAVRIEGKGREFGRLVNVYEERLDELRESMRTYDSWYGFVYDNLHRVYQGIGVRMRSDVPEEAAKEIVDEAVGLTALCQVLNEGEVYDWSLEVTFEYMKDGQSEKVLTYTLPQDTIDYEEVYRKLKEKE